MKVLAAFLLVLGLASASVPAVAANDVKCELCKKLITYVDDWLESGAGQKEIEILIHQFCKMVGPAYEPVCDVILKMEIKQLIAWIESFPPQQVCSMIRLCPKTEEPAPPTDDNCKICKTVIGFVEEWLKSGAGKQEVKVLLEQLCKIFPQYKTVCEQIIEMGIDQLISWVTHYTPEQVCQMIRLCPKAAEPNDKCSICKRVIGFIEDWLESGAGKKEIKVLVDALCAFMGPEYKDICDAILMMEIEQLIAWIKQYSPQQVCQLMRLCPKTVEETNDNCKICKTVIGFIEEWLKSGAGKKEVKVLLEQLCKLFPQYKTVCEKIIEMEIDQLIEWLTHYTPEQVCGMIRLCPKFEETNDNCKICKTVIGFIEEWLKSGAGKKEVKVLLEQLCKLFPQYKTVCEKIIEMEIDQLIEWLTHFTPEQVCGMIRLCPKVEAVNSKCSICKVVIGLIEHWLEEKKTIEEIKALVHDLCSVMGPTYAPICNMLLEKGVDQIIHWIETSATPEIVCLKLKMCTAAVDKIDKCSVCKIAYDVLKQFLINPRTEQEIITFLDHVCDFFPKYQAVCDELIAFGVMELVELVKQYDDITVCRKVHLCQ